MLTSSYPTKKDPSSGPFIQHLARSLHKQDIDLSVLIYANDGILKEYRDEAGIRIIEYPYSLFLPPLLHKHFGLVPTLKRSLLARIEFPLYIGATFYFLWKYAKNYDLVHAHWFLPSGFIAALYYKLTRKPFIVTAWGAEFHLPRNFLFRKILSFVYLNADCAIAVSNYMKHISLQYFQNTMKVLPNGIDVDMFRPVRSENKNNNVIIGAVRLLVPEKRIQDLLHAVSLLPERLKKYVSVHIVGDGPERKNLERLANKLKIDTIVTFFGYVPYLNVQQHLSKMDIVVNPSIQEGMATVNLEAMAMGKPVIATRGYGNDETIIQGKTGFLYTPRNASELKKRLMMLIRDKKLREDMGSRGRMLVEKRFSIDTVARDYVQLYKRVLHKKYDQYRTV